MTAQINALCGKNMNRGSRTEEENYCSARRNHLGGYFVERMAMEGYILTAVMQEARQHLREYTDSDRDC